MPSVELRMRGLRSPVRMVLEGLEGIALLVLCVATWPLARAFLRDLGARPDERARDWPGDGLLERIDERTTRAVDVCAPAADVWPWLVQLGLGRAGFYSYELIERLGGIDVRNVERVLPELQSLAVGDDVVLHPSAPPLTVALLEPPESLCFRTWKDDADLAERDPRLAATWCLYIAPASASSCRLLLRSCKHLRRPRGIGARLAATFFEDPLDLVMEQRLLRTVRRLAERGRPAT